jgi:hypothetical protein
MARDLPPPPRMDERPRWLRALEAGLLWALGAAAACVVDLALAQRAGCSPVLANPLRDPHPVGLLDLVGWVLAGTCLPAAARLQRLPPLALATLTPIAGVAMAVARGRGCAIGAVSVAAIGMLVAPALEARHARRGWPARWLVAALLMAWFALDDPAFGIDVRGDYRVDVLRWIGAAACGAAHLGLLWRGGLRLTAAAAAPFWAGAVWTLVANCLSFGRGSSYTGGLIGSVWRCGGPKFIEFPAPPPMRAFLWPSLGELALLVGLLWLVERAARHLDGPYEPAADPSPDGSTQRGERAAEAREGRLDRRERVRPRTTG